MSKKEPNPSKRCPYLGDAGFVSAGRIKKEWGGGWLVAYDRTKGPTALTADKLPWTEASRWLVLWMPAGRRFKAFGTEAEARKVVWAATKGQDLAGFWTSSPVKIATPDSPPVADCLTHTCARDQQSPPTTPSRNLAPPIESRELKEQEVPLALRLRQLVLAKVSEKAYAAKIAELMEATKQVVQNGTLIDVPDYAIQHKAAQDWKDFMVGKAMLEQVIKEMKRLDESCLEQQVLTSAAGRMELLMMIIEAEPGILQRYQREGARLGV